MGQCNSNKNSNDKLNSNYRKTNKGYNTPNSNLKGVKEENIEILNTNSDKIVKTNNSNKNSEKNNKIIKIECKICNCDYSNIKYPVVLECGHSICIDCFNLIMNKSKKCPFDNSILTNTSPNKNYELMDILEIANNNNNNTPKADYPALNEVISQNYDNIDDLIQKSVPNQIETSKKILLCPNSHNLKWTGSLQTCVRCGAKDFCLTCPSDKYSLCLTNCLCEKIKFKTNFCLMNHPLTWTASKFNCMQCHQSFKYGFTCKDCKNFFQCLYCSDFIFNTSNCPNSHKISWVSKEKECSRCSLLWTCFGCEVCKYFLCNKKCLDDFDKNSIKFYLNRITNIKTFEVHKEAVSCVIKLTGEVIATSSADKSIKLWKYPSGTHITTLNGHTDHVEFMIKINEELFASCGDDKNVIIWNFRFYKQEGVLKGHKGWVLSLALLNFENNLMIASSSMDNSIKIWDIKSLNCSFTLEGHSKFVPTLCYVPLLNFLVSGSGDKTIKIWSLFEEGYRLIDTLKGHSDWVTCLALLEEFLLASGSADSTIRIWNLDYDDTHNRSSFVCIKILKGHTDSVLSLIKLNDEEFASAGGKEDKSVKIWNFKEGKILKQFFGHLDKVYSLFKMNENELISGSRDKYIKFWKY